MAVNRFDASDLAVTPLQVQAEGPAIGPMGLAAQATTPSAKPASAPSVLPTPTSPGGP